MSFDLHRFDDRQKRDQVRGGLEYFSRWCAEKAGQTEDEAAAEEFLAGARAASLLTSVFSTVNPPRTLSENPQMQGAMATIIQISNERILTPSADDADRRDPSLRTLIRRLDHDFMPAVYDANNCARATHIPVEFHKAKKPDRLNPKR
jgi:hypothetical protein